MQIYEANKRNEKKPFFEEVKYFNCKQSALRKNCKDSEKKKCYITNRTSTDRMESIFVQHF
jgi:hypothetical protein